jgi:hypothetical protein
MDGRGRTAVAHPIRVILRSKIAPERLVVDQYALELAREVAVVMHRTVHSPAIVPEGD